MTQDERWMTNWQEVMSFMEANKRRPPKFVDSERGEDREVQSVACIRGKI